jgi:tRNA modification GTPase
LQSLSIGRKLTQLPDSFFIPPRQACYKTFFDSHGEPIDQGLLLYFAAPHSFTGEDVIELHGHGGPVVMNCLLKRVLELGAVMAQPGEFSQRAFLNDKLDLAQAEAIADLIDSSSTEAARCALRSLQGAFSQRIHVLNEQLIELRLFVEAAIDFPDEDIDFLSDDRVRLDLVRVRQQLDAVFAETRHGVLLRDGIRLVLAGLPNAGKSSLLNALSGRDSAIVTAIPGTTRDVLAEYIQLDGLPVQLVDTAGLRFSEDAIEQEGIRRAWKEVDSADAVLLVIDGSTLEWSSTRELFLQVRNRLSRPQVLTLVFNKTDLRESKINPSSIHSEMEAHSAIHVSAKTGLGLEELRSHLKKRVGYQTGEVGGFIARTRHLDALQRASRALDCALENRMSGELLAEDLRLAHQCLGEITGEFTSDDLLGRIFSSFCIGK